MGIELALRLSPSVNDEGVEGDVRGGGGRKLLTMELESTRSWTEGDWEGKNRLHMELILTR